MPATTRSPVTVLTTPGSLFSWTDGLPPFRSESWDTMDCVTIRFNDGSEQQVAFFKDVIAIDFFSTLHLANGYRQDLQVVGMDVDR